MAHVSKGRGVTIRALQEAGLPVSTGRRYVRQEWLPRRRMSLSALHRKLARFQGSLADEIAQAREEG